MRLLHGLLLAMFTSCAAPTPVGTDLISVDGDEITSDHAFFERFSQDSEDAVVCVIQLAQLVRSRGAQSEYSFPATGDDLFRMELYRAVDGADLTQLKSDYIDLEELDRCHVEVEGGTVRLELRWKEGSAADERSRDPRDIVWSRLEIVGLRGSIRGRKCVYSTIRIGE